MPTLARDVLDFQQVVFYAVVEEVDYACPRDVVWYSQLIKNLSIGFTYKDVGIGN